MASKIFPRGKKGFLYFIYREAGKQKWFNCRTTDRMDALRQRNDKERELLNRKAGRVNTEGTWESYCKNYLAYSHANKRPRSYKKDLSIIGIFNRVSPIRYFREFDFTVLSEYKGKRKEMGVKESTINRELHTLKNMGSVAMDLGYAESNPVQRVKCYSVEDVVKERFLTLEEIRFVLKSIESRPLLSACWLGLYAGLRLGESLHLLWKNVDFEHNLIRLEPVNGWRPKTVKKKTPQIIPLHGKLRSYLSKIPRCGEFVCAYEDGTTPSEDTAAVILRKRFIQMGLPGVTSHTLRHTCLSHLTMSGADFFFVSRVARHTDPKMTMRYAHLSPTYQQNQIDKLPY